MSAPIEREPGWRSSSVIAARKACPNRSAHYPEPDGLSYGGFDEWCRKMSTTHRQSRCPGCNLFVLWTPFDDILDPEAAEGQLLTPEWGSSR